MKQTETAVLYNANCPVCNFEIGHYQTYADANGLPIRFDDLNTDALAKWGLTEDQAARRLYVAKDGELTSGITAFLILWQDMPRYRMLGKIAGLPVVKRFAEIAYDYVLAPVIYRWHLHRKQAKSAH